MNLSNNHSTITELLPAYALGILEDEESFFVSTHLVDCPDCQVELDVLQQVVAQIPLASPEVQPPPHLYQRLLASIQPPAPASSPHPPQLSWWQQVIGFPRQHKALAYTQVALLLCVVILFATTLLLWQRLNQLTPDADAQQIQAIRLNSSGAVAEADGYLLISHDGLSGAVVVDQLPQLDPDQQYQLWLIGEDGIDSGAVLSIDELGYGGTRVRAPQSLFLYSRAEITIEPAAENTYPTGEVILTVPLFAP